MAAKTMKRSLEPSSSGLHLDMKSGMYVLGYKRTLKMSRQGKAELVILASTCPAWREPEVEQCALWARLVSITSVNNTEVGTAYGKS